MFVTGDEKPVATRDLVTGPSLLPQRSDGASKRGCWFPARLP